MKIILYSILFFLFANCKHSDKNPNKLTLETLEKTKLTQGWKQYSDKKIRALIPSNWTPKVREDILFLVPIDKKLNLYYVASEYDIERVISTKNYLQEIFKQISVDTPTFNYSMSKINFTNGKVCYLLEFDRTENGHNYKFFNVIYPIEKKIYDFGFNTINDPKSYAENKRLFYDVLVTLEQNDKKIIASEDFIVQNAKEIKYEDL
ncbi:hypothetical protein [Flavobacterium maritimum]|uniref:hypothetical protein n=1 Tax=Flavobacterium maritimum TaxID=3149042 RepID=UPI0032B38F60